MKIKKLLCGLLAAVLLLNISVIANAAETNIDPNETISYFCFGDMQPGDENYRGN